MWNKNNENLKTTEKKNIGTEMVRSVAVVPLILAKTSIHSNVFMSLRHLTVPNKLEKNIDLISTPNWIRFNQLERFDFIWCAFFFFSMDFKFMNINNCSFTLRCDCSISKHKKKNKIERNFNRIQIVNEMIWFVTWNNKEQHFFCSSNSKFSLCLMYGCVTNIWKEEINVSFGIEKKRKKN